MITMRILLYLLLFSTVCCQGTAQETAEKPSHSAALFESFDVRWNVLGYGLFNSVAESDVNQHNVLGIPDKKFELIARPNLYLNYDDLRLRLECKPRLALRGITYSDGIYMLKAAEDEVDTYVNEWQIQYGLTQRLFLAGGRQNLQWGPSYLLSPSNPFFTDNGRNNPYVEVPGLDYLRAVWLPNDIWSFSVIANIGQGMSDPAEKFRNRYAYKVDATGYKKYGGVIVSKRESEEADIGYYGGLTATDYLLLYLEGNWDTADSTSDVLAGGAYTFRDGSNMALEYFFQGSGCSKDPFRKCVISEADYNDLFDRFDNYSGSYEDLLDEIEALDLRLNTKAYFRRNYIMAQYMRSRMWDTTSMTLRWVLDVDDLSSRIIGLADVEINHNMAIVLAVNVFTGGGDTEFGSFLNQAVMAGMNVYF